MNTDKEIEGTLKYNIMQVCLQVSELKSVESPHADNEYPNSEILDNLKKKCKIVFKKSKNIPILANEIDLESLGFKQLAEEIERLNKE